MDPLQTLNQAGPSGLNLTITSINIGAPALSNAATNRCGCSGSGGGFPSGGFPSGGFPGGGFSGLGGPSALLPGAGLNGLSSFGAPAAVDPMQGLLQTQNLMNQTLMQLMQLMVQLMANRSGGGSQAAAGTPSADTAAASSSSGGGSGATAGMPGATDTGSKLAGIAKAEATNGDSDGGLCYRDVGRALSKIGINVSGASAYMAAAQLEKNPKVKEMKVAQGDLPKLPAGAIVVWDKGNGHEHGHISIATGDGKEASDLMRNQITNYGTSFRVFMPQ